MHADEIHHHLKQLRTERGHTQRALAAALGVDVSTITHVERGSRRPSIELLTAWVAHCHGRILILHDDKPQSAWDEEFSAHWQALSPADRVVLTRIAAALPRVQPFHREHAAALLEYEATALYPKPATVQDAEEETDDPDFERDLVENEPEPDAEERARIMRGATLRTR